MASINIMVVIEDLENDDLDEMESRVERALTTLPKKLGTIASVTEEDRSEDEEDETDGEG